MTIRVESKIPYVKPVEFQPHVLIVESRFHGDVEDRLLKGAGAALTEAQATFEVVTVPGSTEIPYAIQYAVKSMDYEPGRKRYDAYVALGCILHGETRHHEIVGDLSARGLQEITLRYTLAVGNGILTCETLEQALERASPERHDRGGEAARTALHMLHLKNHFRLVVPKRRWVPPRA